VGFPKVRQNPPDGSLFYPDRPRLCIPTKRAEASKNFRTSTTANPRFQKSEIRSNSFREAGLTNRFRSILEWKHSCILQRLRRVKLIFSRAWGTSGHVPFIYFPGRPACNLSSAVRERRRGEFWSRHGNESENRTIRDAAGTMRARCLRFDFMAGFYAVFCFTLEHHLHYILNFRDDISGGKRARGLTTWDLNHRAGPAPPERVPRPSYL
jgi:hypothetical protein